jgi:hypothetical protein
MAPAETGSASLDCAGQAGEILCIQEARHQPQQAYPSGEGRSFGKRLDKRRCGLRAAVAW